MQPTAARTYSEPGLWGEEEGGAGRPAWAASHFVGASRAQMGGQEVTDSGQRKRQKDVPEGEVGTSGHCLTESPEGTCASCPWMQLRDHGGVGQHPFTMRAKVRDA